MDKDRRESKFKQRKLTEKEILFYSKNGGGENSKVRTSSRNSRIPISTFRSKCENTVRERGDQNYFVSKQATQATKTSSKKNSRVQDKLNTPASSQKDYLGFKSKSGVSIITRVSVRNEATTSTGRSNKGTSCITKEEFQDLNTKGTMTKCDDLEFAKEIRSILERRTNELSAKNFKKCLIDNPYEHQFSMNSNLNITIEPPLEQKFSVIRVPTWKRSWTFPVITRKVGIQRCSYPENDNRTYVYDDGSEIDSVVLRRNELMQRFFPIDHLGFFYALCAVCAFVMVMYVAFGNEIIQYFFPQEEPECFIGWFIDFFGRGFAYLFLGFFRTLGAFLNMPNPEPDEPRNPFRWKGKW